MIRKFDELTYHKKCNAVRSNTHFGKFMEKKAKKNSLIRPLQLCPHLDTCLCICHDGTIVHCSGAYINQFEPYIEQLKADGVQSDLDFCMITNPNIYNPINMTEDEINKMNWYIVTGYRQNNITYHSLKMALVEELSRAHQIPAFIAENEQMLYEITTATTDSMTCSRENEKDTGLPFLPEVSTYRKLLNGAMQYVIDFDRQSVLQEFSEFELKEIQDEQSRGK